MKRKKSDGTNKSKIPDSYVIIEKSAGRLRLPILDTLIYYRYKEYILTNTADNRIKTVSGEGLLDHFLQLLDKKYKGCYSLAFSSETHPVKTYSSREKVIKLWKTSSSFKKLQTVISHFSEGSSILRIIKKEKMKSIIFKIVTKDNPLNVSPKSLANSSAIPIKRPMLGIEALATSVCNSYKDYLQNYLLPFALTIDFIRVSKEKWVFLSSRPSNWPGSNQQSPIKQFGVSKHRKSVTSVLEFSKKIFTAVENCNFKDSIQSCLKTYIDQHDFKNKQTDCDKKKIIKKRSFSESNIPKHNTAETYFKSAIENFELMRLGMGKTKQPQPIDVNNYGGPYFWHNFIHKFIEKARNNAYLHPYFYLISQTRIDYFVKMFTVLMSKKLTPHDKNFIRSFHKDLMINSRIHLEFIECTKIVLDDLDIQSNDRMFILHRLWSIQHLIC